MAKQKESSGMLKWLLAAFCFMALLFGAVGTLGFRNALSVSAGETTSTLTFTKACGGSGTADDGAAWTVTSDADEKAFDSTRGIHYGTGSVAVSYLRLTTSSITGTITAITVNASGNSGTSAKLNVTVGGNAFGSQKSITKTATDYELTGSGSGTIVVSLTQDSATIALYCKSIEVVYTSGGSSSSVSSSEESSSSSTSSSSSSSESTPVASYYQRYIDAGKLAGKSGAALADDLHVIMWETTTSRRSYESLKTNLQTTDADPTDSDYIIDFWTGVPMLGAWGNGVWNREHVWPAALSNGAWSRGSPDKSDKYAGCDIHHIRPSASTVNVSRGAASVGVVDQSQPHKAITVNGVTSSCLDGVNSNGDSVFEPGDNRKGDLARIFFYLYVTYSTKIDVKGVETTLTACTSADANYATYTADLTEVIVDGTSLINPGSDYASTIDLLLEWNALDPVDALESQRNEAAYLLQGNRNPFIDFPDIANYIFDTGSFYNLEMDANQTVLYGEEFLPTARTMPLTALPGVAYTSSQSSVISVAGGNTFTVNATGITRITASVTISGISFTKTTNVQVVSEITGITLSVSSYTMAEGKTFYPEAYCVPANAYNRRITWSTSDPSVATVNATTGKIKAVSAGSCSITATAAANNSITATLSLTVTAPEDGLIDIEISDFPLATNAYDNYTWTSGEYSGVGYVFKTDCIQLKSSGDSYLYNSTAFSHGISKIVFFSSGTNSTNNSVYTLRVGTSTITSASGGSSAGNIEVPAYGGSATWTNTTGNSYTHFYFCTTGDKASYLSRIRIIFGDPLPELESLSLDYSNMDCDYNAGESLNLSGLKVTAVYDDGSTKNVTADSTFSPTNGTTLNTGHTAVTVSYSDTTASIIACFAITVAGPRTLSSVSLSPTSKSLYTAETIQLKLTATYNDGSTAVVTNSSTWSSNADAVAEVSSSGLVAALSAGSATITASYSYLGGAAQNASCAVTVSANPFELDETSFTCIYASQVFMPDFTATFGGSDVTSSCTVSPALQNAKGYYSYYKTLGEHRFTVSYSSGGHTYSRTIDVTTTNAGAANADNGYYTYELVDNVSDLVAGQEYIIANAANLTSGTRILSATQNDNNRASVLYTAAGTNFQVLTLGGKSGAWTFYTGSGYLYAASNSSNHLKTRAVNSDANGEWSISVTAAGVATITAQGANSHNLLRYNSTAGSLLFSCYASGQDNVFIYKCIDGTYTTLEQATALKTYLDEFRTCDVVSEADVKRLALEYNTLNCATVGTTTAKATFATLTTAAQFVNGTDYRNGTYITDDPSGDAVSCLTKLRYIVGRWNSAHTNDLVYLYTDSYYNGTDNGGSGTKETPYAANPIAIKQQQSSPLTATLWIVLGSGSIGIGLILGAYLVSKKKKKHRA